ncbi:MAG: hypothetical protein J3Q66DRAFT_446195 [Benniella sp.]|nr:MAG: hypothetical protein J3Q66DRAFT_446195 [Benniella sp.]
MGANSGHDYVTTVALAARGVHVFLACRSKERAMGAMKRARSELAHRLADEKVYVNVAHPGYIATGLNRHDEESMGHVLGKLSNVAEWMLALKPRQGALTQLYLATSPDIERDDIRSRYFMQISNEIRPIPISKNRQSKPGLRSYLNSS